MIDARATPAVRIPPTLATVASLLPPIAVGLAFVGLAAAVGWLVFGSEGREPLTALARVASASETVWIATPGQTLPTFARLDPGDPVQIGAIVHTGDAGRIVLSLAGGREVDLRSRARLRALAPDLLALDRGALSVAASPTVASDPLRIVTPFGVLQATGASFEIRLEAGTLTLTAREGAVALFDGRTVRRVDAPGVLHLPD